MSRSHGPDEFLDPRDTSADAIPRAQQADRPDSSREQGLGGDSPEAARLQTDGACRAGAASNLLSRARRSHFAAEPTGSGRQKSRRCPNSASSVPLESATYANSRTKGTGLAPQSTSRTSFAMASSQHGKFHIPRPVRGAC